MGDRGERRGEIGGRMVRFAHRSEARSERERRAEAGSAPLGSRVPSKCLRQRGLLASSRAREDPEAFTLLGSTPDPPHDFGVGGIYPRDQVILGVTGDATGGGARTRRRRVGRRQLHAGEGDEFVTGAGTDDMVFELDRHQYAVGEGPTRDVIARAQGILIERTGMSADEAYAELRRYSERTSMPLHARAEAIVASTAHSSAPVRTPSRVEASRCPPCRPTHSTELVPMSA